VLRSRIVQLASLAFIAACGGEPIGPRSDAVSLMVQTGADQFGLAGSTLLEPLQVIVLDPVTRRPVRDVRVEWRVLSGAGANITTSGATTGVDGEAQATARLGTALGEYVFEAVAPNLEGPPARFTAHAVQRPTITGVSPRTADAGDTIVITGTNFSTTAADQVVLFSGLRGRVVSATATRLSVIVPPCMPSLRANLTVSFGAVASALDSINVLGTGAPLLQLERGEVRVLREATEMVCQRIGVLSNAQYLIVGQNTSDVVGTQTSYELLGLAEQPLVAVPAAVAFSGARADFGADWETRLRARERLFRGPAQPTEPMAAFRVKAPEIGERSEFRVFDKDSRFTSVTAEVKAISQRAIIYQDINAPANGFTTAQLQQLGSAFDSPTYEVDVGVYGEPSDIDGNGKVVILLTPVVNELTPRNSTGFVAGFFYGCDLQTRNECGGSNLAEMFYLLVPDPAARHGDARTPQFVMTAALPVLAHEFQHMISFGARQSLDALWLSEGLAHHAEDLVASEYLRRGDTQAATSHAQPNYTRASFYLRDSTTVGLLNEELPGSLQQRGGAWLFVKYLADQYGGNTLLRALSSARVNGPQNVSAATGRPWNALLSDWALALWADDAPELAGVQINARYQYTSINLRTTINTSGSFSLRPAQIGFSGFARQGTLEASSMRFFLLGGASASAPLHLAFSGKWGGPFAASASPQITVLRVR
jgi:IPT/TIG domain-containing protein